MELKTALGFVSQRLILFEIFIPCQFLAIILKMVSVGHRNHLVYFGNSMSKKIYIGNLSFQTSEDSLNAKISEFGEVVSLRIITDRDTGRSKGFAFAEFANGEDADKAIEALNGQDFDGRNLRVNEAQDRPDRPRRDSRPRY